MANVVESVYGPFAANRGLPAAKLAAHPSEGQVVGESIAEQTPRLRQEIGTAQPTVLVTLGNAALRVLASLMDLAPPLTKLSIDGYGEPMDVRINATQARWYPLAYPAAPALYQQAHTSWRPL